MLNSWSQNLSSYNQDQDQDLINRSRGGLKARSGLETSHQLINAYNFSSINYKSTSVNLTLYSHYTSQYKVIQRMAKHDIEMTML